MEIFKTVEKIKELTAIGEEMILPTDRVERKEQLKKVKKLAEELLEIIEED